MTRCSCSFILGPTQAHTHPEQCAFQCSVHGYAFQCAPIFMVQYLCCCCVVRLDSIFVHCWVFNIFAPFPFCVFGSTVSGIRTWIWYGHFMQCLSLSTKDSLAYTVFFFSLFFGLITSTQPYIVVYSSHGFSFHSDFHSLFMLQAVNFDGKRHQARPV